MADFSTTLQHPNVVGWLFVMGRKAGVITVADMTRGRGPRTLTATCRFTTIPASVDPFLSTYAGLSHIALSHRGKTHVYRVESGHIADGHCRVTLPSIHVADIPDYSPDRMPLAF